MSALEEAGKGRVKRVVLVSDGLDSTRAEAERLARTSAEKGVTVSSLGIGLDFDASYMSGVASIGHGNFGFVKDPGALVTFLQRELHETAATTIEGARVRIKLPNGVRVSHASGADYTEVGDGEIELRLGSLFAGDERRVLLEMTARAEPGDTKTFEATASWNVVGGPSVNAPSSHLTIAAATDQRDVEGSRDNDVMASAISVTASRRQLEATEAYERGDVLGAQGLIDKNLRELQAAQAYAPPAAAEGLKKQTQAYDGTKHVFATAAPTSAAGNAAAKGAVEKDMSNMGRAAAF
jgi:Ca-activated chloride channel family protein